MEEGTRNMTANGGRCTRRCFLTLHSPHTLLTSPLTHLTPHSPHFKCLTCQTSTRFKQHKADVEKSVYLFSICLITFTKTNEINRHPSLVQAHTKLLQHFNYVQTICIVSSVLPDWHMSIPNRWNTTHVHTHVWICTHECVCMCTLECTCLIYYIYIYIYSVHVFRWPRACVHVCIHM